MSRKWIALIRMALALAFLADSVDKTITDAAESRFTTLKKVFINVFLSLFLTHLTTISQKILGTRAHFDRINFCGRLSNRWDFRLVSFRCHFQSQIVNTRLELILKVFGANVNILNARQNAH